MRSAVRSPSERYTSGYNVPSPCDEPPRACLTLRRLAADRCPEPLLGTRRRDAPLRRGQEAPSGRALRRSPHPTPPPPHPPHPPTHTHTPTRPDPRTLLEPQNWDRVTAAMPTTVDYGVQKGFESGGLVFCLWSGLVIVSALYYSSDALVPALDVRACSAQRRMSGATSQHHSQRATARNVQHTAPTMPFGACDCNLMHGAYTRQGATCSTSGSRPHATLCSSDTISYFRIANDACCAAHRVWIRSTAARRQCLCSSS